MRASLAARPSVKGEITLLIGKGAHAPPVDHAVEEAVEACMREGMSRMDAIKEVARRRGLSKREVYRQTQREAERLIRRSLFESRLGGTNRRGDPNKRSPGSTRRRRQLSPFPSKAY